MFSIFEPQKHMRPPLILLLSSLSASVMQILSTLGVGVQIQRERVAKGGVVAVDTSQPPAGFTVHSGKERPDEAFVAVLISRLVSVYSAVQPALQTTSAAINEIADTDPEIKPENRIERNEDHV
jgi:hypothetical protein